MLTKLLSLFLTLTLLSWANSTMGAGVTTTFVPQTPDVQGNVNQLAIDVSQDLEANPNIKIEYILPDNSGTEFQSFKVQKFAVRRYTFSLYPSVPANTAFDIIVYFPDGTSERRRLNVTNPLPVELVSFRAEKAEKQVNLTWETASEKNNDYFIIERSANGRNFEAIGKVKGAGNSNTVNAYAFADKNPMSGVSYYRLKQIDFDGKFEYSKIVSVTFESKLTSVVLAAYPNPAINELNVNVNGLQGKATLDITDATGRSLKQISVNGSETTTLNVETLPKGIYQIRVISENGTSVSKFLKQ